MEGGPKICVMCKALQVAGDKALVRFYLDKFINVDTVLCDLDYNMIYAIKVITNMDPDIEWVRYLWMTAVIHYHCTLDEDAAHKDRVKVLWVCDVPANALGCVSPRECGHTFSDMCTLLAKGDPFTVPKGIIPFSDTDREQEDVLMQLCIKFIRKAQFLTTPEAPQTPQKRAREGEDVAGHTAD